MGLFGALIRTVTLPVAAVADIVTLGGNLIGKDETFTGEQAGKIGEELDEIF